MRVVFGTAELVPLTRVGGLGEASAGLVRELRALGVEVEVVLPDYSGAPLGHESVRILDVPDWAAPARARSGVSEGIGSVTLIEAPGLARPHPYNDPTSGEGWPDNTARFFAYSAALASLTAALAPDVLHLNDWHTAPVLGMLATPPPSLLTLHNLAYQGWASEDWLARLEAAPAAYSRDDGCNALAGGIALADRVVAVSPTYAREILDPAAGFGLDGLLRERGAALVGIRNGIDVASWDPSTDHHLPARYDSEHLEAKSICKSALLEELRWQPSDGPLVAMVTRLASQKGIDLALDVMPALAEAGARLVLLGSGDRDLAERARSLAAAHPEALRFVEDFNDGLAHRLFAGSDLLLMPSRFEPCGLTQMQAMAYGTIPVVTPVGGLLDTVRDADRTVDGQGFMASAIDATSLLEAARRASAAWRDPRRRLAIQRQGMRQDWSWREPAHRYVALYEELCARA